MEWYYAHDGERKGPVNSTRLLELRQDGTLDDESFVWNEAMADWAPLATCLSQVEADGEAAPDPLVEATAVCIWSGQVLPQSEMLNYGDDWVAPEHKDAFVQHLQEGGDSDGGDSQFDPSELQTDLSFASIIVQSAKIWWANIVPIATVTIVIWLPLNLVLEYVSYLMMEDDETIEEIAGGIRDAIRYDRFAEFFIGVICTGGVLWTACRAWEGRPRPSIGRVFHAGLGNWPRMVGTRILFGLFFFLLMIPGLLLIIPLQPVLIGLAALYLVVVLLIYFVRLAFSEMAAISHEAGGMPALIESRRVTRGRFWRIVGYQILVYGMIFAVSLAIGLLHLIPVLDNFVASGVTSTLVNVILTFGLVEMLVLYKHLEKNALED